MNNEFLRITLYFKQNSTLFPEKCLYYYSMIHVWFNIVL